MNPELTQSEPMVNEHPHRVRAQPVPGEPNLRVGLGKRLLLMVGSFVGYSLAEFAAKLILVSQIFYVAITGRTISWLLEQRQRVSRYIHSAWNYLLFVNQAPPWPLQRFVTGAPRTYEK